MKDDLYFMNKALEEAKKALKEDEVPVGAIVVKDGKIISKAHNQKEKLQLATAHAEILAINKACKKLKSWHLDDCIMYVTLEPCHMCAGALINSRIKTLVYGSKSYQDGVIESKYQIFDIKGFNHYVETKYFVQLEKCSTIISDYFKNKR